MGAIIRLAVTWRWRFMQRVVGKVSSGFPMVMEGGEDVGSFSSQV